MAVEGLVLLALLISVPMSCALWFLMGCPLRHYMMLLKMFIVTTVWFVYAVLFTPRGWVYIKVVKAALAEVPWKEIAKVVGLLLFVIVLLQYLM